MVRLTKIELENFKNVELGAVPLSSWELGKPLPDADIVGIYGQNGSGKTSVIRALSILKTALAGRSISAAAKECIAEGASSAVIAVEGGLFSKEGASSMGAFKLSLTLTTLDGTPVISGERLALKQPPENGRTKVMRTLFDYQADAQDQGSFTLDPKGAWNALMSIDERTRTDILLAQRLSLADGRSFLFSSEMRGTLSRFVKMPPDSIKTNKARAAVTETAYPLALAASGIALFSLQDLTVISTREQAESMTDRLHIATHEGSFGSLAGTYFDVDIKSPAALSNDQLLVLQGTVAKLNPVLGALVPGLQLGVKALGARLLDDGNTGATVEITSKRGETVVPLRCESEGIKKLVSILIALVDVYTKPGACVAIDEFDSGIFEFLLGELLQVLRDHGRGQLVFTAHNLRPLEVLDSSSLIFTTTNPRNRYVKFRGSRETNNLRDQYLRAVNLGGQSETIYEPTSTFAIDCAFYEAGHQGADAGLDAATGQSASLDGEA